MAAPLTVDPDQIEDAADVFGSQVASDLFTVSNSLALAMKGTMAGNDQAGNEWSSAYDEAATTVMGATADLINGSYKLASMLLVTGDNHKRADEFSQVNHPGVPSVYLPKLYQSDFVKPFVVPPAGGAGSAAPAGWSVIENAVGYAWPGGHQDKLRATAQAWDRAANGLNDAGWQIPGATAELIVNESPEIGTAYVVSRSMGRHITDLADAYRSLSDACNRYAGYIDQAHRDAEDELSSLIKWTVGIEAAGVLASFFTFGGAELPTQGIEAGRIAATAARIADIIRSLIAQVKIVTEAISNVIARAAGISKGLKGLLGARLSKATAELVSHLGGSAKTAEELAETELVEDASPGVKDGWEQRPAANGKGTVWQEPGSVNNANSIRIVDAGADARYPDGYVRYYNDLGQPLDLNGKPGSQAATHIARCPDGSYPVPRGWDR